MPHHKNAHRTRAIGEFCSDSIITIVCCVPLLMKHSCVHKTFSLELSLYLTVSANRVRHHGDIR